MNKQPKIEIKQRPFDKYLSTLALMFGLLLFAVPFYYFSELPEIIPIHFGMNGEADGFGNKWLIWLLPIIGLAIHLFFKWIVKNPHLCNYPVKITEENAEFQYSLCIRFMKALDVLILCMFSFLILSICKIGVNEATGINNLFLFSFIGLTFLIIIVYLFMASKAKRGLK